jgi:hypothetical protein
MSMPEPKYERSLTTRGARWALDCAVKHWPEETRQWGIAMAAEIDEATNPFEAIRWSLGGIMFFARAVFSETWRWLKLPAGSSFPDGSTGEPAGPKHSRLFTAAILAAAAILLIFPEGREAIRTVRSTWQRDFQSESNASKLEELAARAEKEKDSDLLAFTALSATDRARGAELTERAVAQDPKFIWVYAVRNHSPKNDPAREDWLARVQAADPGNAVPDLLMADALVQPRLAVLLEHGSVTSAYRPTLEADPKWVALMDRAFDEPRYDSYFQRHYRLTRTIWNREKNLPPTMVLSGIWQHAMPSLLNLRLYADIKIDDARKAREAGDFKRAETLLNGVASFGGRIVDSEGTDIEKLIGFAIERNANKELSNLYAATGQKAEAQVVTARLAQIEDGVHNFRPGNPARSARAEAFTREAALVQGFGTLCLIAALTTLAAILMLELGPSKAHDSRAILRRCACFAADYGPAALLISCGAFLVSFLPFQRAFEDYRASSYMLGAEQNLTDAMWGLIQIPQYVVGVDSGVQRWSLVTMALSALLLLVVVRGFYRTRRPAQNPA